MRRRGAIAVCAITMGCAAAELHAQEADPGELDRIERAVDAGSIDGLRNALEAWLGRASGLDAETMGRARYLRARLMSDADSARTEYLAVAVDGRSSYGAPAWLKLAQLELARGEPARAVADLERLRGDYPGSDLGARALFWTARAHEVSGDLEAACAMFDRALAEASRLRDEETGERAATSRRSCEPGGLRFTLQIGAFTAKSAAESLAATASELGFPTRVIDDQDLRKVRVGLFASPDAARALERRLRAQGFSVAIVAAES